MESRQPFLVLVRPHEMVGKTRLQCSRIPLGKPLSLWLLRTLPQAVLTRNCIVTAKPTASRRSGGALEGVLPIPFIGRVGQHTDDLRSGETPDGAGT